MKRIICLLLCASLLFIVAGCGQGSDTPAGTETEPPAQTPTNAPVQPEPEDKNFTITLSFLGDMLLACQKDQTTAGSFNEYTNKHPSTYFLDKVRHILEADDFTVANLENVLTDKNLKPIEKDYNPAFWFKAKTSNIEILSSSSVEGVLLNNNHTGDYGYAGFNDTVDAVEGAGIQYGSDNKVIYFEKNGFKIGVICTGLWSSWNANIATNRLNEIKDKTDYQIIFFHGGTEKIHAPEKMKIDAARKFVDNGADLVVGGHPHVLQPREIYKGVEIIYSVGNFCYGGHRKPENRTIIYQITLTVNGENNTVAESNSNIIPCYVYTGSVNNYQPAVIEEEDIKQRVLDFMNGKIDSPV